MVDARKLREGQAIVTDPLGVSYTFVTQRGDQVWLKEQPGGEDRIFPISELAKSGWDAADSRREVTDECEAIIIDGEHRLFHGMQRISEALNDYQVIGMRVFLLPVIGR